MMGRWLSIFECILLFQRISHTTHTFTAFTFATMKMPALNDLTLNYGKLELRIYDSAAKLAKLAVWIEVWMVNSNFKDTMSSYIFICFSQGISIVWFCVINQIRLAFPVSLCLVLLQVIFIACAEVGITALPLAFLEPNY